MSGTAHCRETSGHRSQSLRLSSVLHRFANGTRPRLWWEFGDGHRERIVDARKIARDVVRVRTETREFSESARRVVYTREGR
jgi:hypothetical protein